MSLENYKLFVARGRSLELAKAHVAERSTAHAARREHAKRTAGPDAEPYGTDYSYYGVVTKTAPDPALWRPAPKKLQCPKHEDESYTPNLKTKEGKALHEEIGRTSSPTHSRHKVFSFPDMDEFSKRLGYGQYISGMSLWTAQLVQVGDEIVILVPKVGPQIVPQDSEPCPLSRYYALKEADEKAS